MSDADQEIPTQGKQITSETRFTEFQALSIGLRVGISRSASKTLESDRLFFLPITGKSPVFIKIFLFFPLNFYN